MNFIDNISAVIVLKRRSSIGAVLKNLYKRLSQRVHGWDEAWKIIDEHACGHQIGLGINYGSSNTISIRYENDIDEYVLVDIEDCESIILDDFD